MTKKTAPLIALLTDFGNRDYYLAAVKGVILTVNPRARIVDICHEIPPQNINEAAYVLAACYRYFPAGSIMVAVVDPGVGTTRRIVCAEAGGYRFLAPDNGVLSFVSRKEKVRQIVEVVNRKYFLKPVSPTFHGRDIFAPVAAHLSKGIAPAELGGKISRIVELRLPEPVISGDGSIRAEIIHIDRFGNLITNLSRGRLAGALTEGWKIQVAKRVIKGISGTYGECRPGELIAVFGSTGHVEISVNGGSAQKLLKAKKGDKISIERIS